jgi:hypothetical protein
MLNQRVTTGIISIAFAACVILLAFQSTVLASKIGELRVVGSDGKIVTYSSHDLAKLPQHTLTTHTAWTSGSHEFAGVRLADLLKASGIEPKAKDYSHVIASALNDYVIDIPFEDVAKYDVLVATSMDGRPLTVRDKGPYWLVYPRDQFEELRDPRFDNRWAWQLKELRMKSR